MSTPGIITGRNLVIASVQTNPKPTPDFQVSDTYPRTRPNGGDLMNGDMWWNPIEQYLYVYNGEGWAVANAVPGLRVSTNQIDTDGEGWAIAPRKTPPTQREFNIQINIRYITLR